MNKSRRFWRKVVLSGLILLSFVLSTLLFSTGSNMADDISENTNIATNQPAPSNIDRGLTEVYQPYQMVMHTPNENNIKYIVRSQELFDQIINMLGEVQLGINETPRAFSVQEYQTLVGSDQWIELVFPDILPMGIYTHLFEDLPTDISERTFNRIFIQNNDSNILYFYNMKEELLWEMPIEKKPTDPLPRVTEEMIGSIAPAFGLQTGENWTYLPTKGVTVERQNYIIDRLPNSVYINQFFTDTSSVESRTSQEVVRYIDLTKEVTINELTKTLNFLSQQSEPEEISLNQRFRMNFDTLNRFENWQEEVVYRDYHPKNHYFVYQRLIDGLPVFSKDGYESLVEISNTSSGLVHLRLPLRFIRTPINIEENRLQVLPSGYDVIEQLEKAGIGIGQDVDQILIGLTWQQSFENENVIFFEPAWYVKYHGHWQALSQLVTSEENDLGL